MKSFYKRLLTGALMLIIVGAAVAGVGYAISRNKEGDTQMENQTYAIADIRSIQIDTDTPNVIITPVDGGQLNLEWQTDEYVEYQATLKDGVLSISYRIRSNWLKNLFSAPFMGTEYILEVELPAGFKGDLDVSAVSGKIIADTAAELNVCSLKSVSGVISAANLHTLSDLTLRSTSGSVSAQALQAGGDIRMQTVSGSLTANNMDAGGAFSLKTTSGKAEITKLTAQGNVALESVSGSLTAQEVSCAAFTAKSVSGSIRPAAIQAQSMEMKSTSGSIKGSVAGAKDDYSISVSTVSGGSNLKNSAGSGDQTLKLSTVSGGINLEFEGGN